jgi:hypothetical protein
MCRHPIRWFGSTVSIYVKVLADPVDLYRDLVLWFSSLACSLAAALFGMMAKQWIREYTNFGMASPRESLRMRQYRYKGLLQWGVFEIIGTLPVLLQIAVILFLIGLIDLLWSLHHAVAAVFTVLAAIPILMAVCMAFIPVFSSSCPYRSPFSFFLIRLLTPLALCLRHWGKFFFVGIPRYYTQRQRLPMSRPLRTAFQFLWNFPRATMVRLPASWSARDIRSVRLADDLEHSALVWAHSSIVDDDLLDDITPCINDLPESDRMRLAFEVVAQKASCDVEHVLSYIRCNDAPTLRSSIPAQRGPIWDEVQNHLALLALPGSAYLPAGTEREVVRQLRMLLDTLGSGEQLPSFDQQASETSIISRRDIVLLIDALLEHMPTAGQLVSKHYYSSMLSAAGESLYHDVRLKAMIMRSLYTFARSRELSQIDVKSKLQHSANALELTAINRCSQSLRYGGKGLRVLRQRSTKVGHLPQRSLHFGEFLRVASLRARPQAPFPRQCSIYASVSCNTIVHRPRDCQRLVIPRMVWMSFHAIRFQPRSCSSIARTNDI